MSENKKVTKTTTTKEFTINEIARKTGFSNGAVRNWAIKPIIGAVYDEEFVNVENVKAQLRKSYNDEARLTEALGCSVDEIVIKKGARTTNSYVDIESLKAGADYILISHHYEKSVTFVGISTDLGTEFFLFKDLNNKHTVMTREELESPKIKLKNV